MKKILITTLIFLFAATTVNYAQIFKPESESAGSSSPTYENSTVSSKESADDYGGFFRAPGNPIDRPETGGGVGQQSPLGDGIRTIAICCFIYCLVKIGNSRKEYE